MNWSALILAILGGVLAGWLLHQRMQHYRGPSFRQVVQRLLVAVGLLSVFTFTGLYFGLAWSRAQVLTHPGRVPVTLTPADFGMNDYEEVTLTSSDGVQLEGWYIPPENGATIILLHGFGDNRTSTLAHNAFLTAAGYGTIAIDFRNHGNSGDSVTTLGYAEVADVQAALDYVLARPETDPNRIGMLGQSMGGATAIRATTRMPEVRALVTESAFSSLDDMIESGIRQVTGLPSWLFAPAIIWFAEQETGHDISLIRPVDDIASISPRPVLLLHGEEDTLVPIWQGEMLYQAAQPPKDFQRYENTGHVGFMATDPQRTRQLILDFYNRWLLGTE